MARIFRPQQQAELKDLAAKMASQGSSCREIAEKWNETHEGEETVTLQAVWYHLDKLKRARLREAADTVAEMTDDTVEVLHAIVTASVHRMVREGEDGAWELIPPEDLDPLDTSGWSIKIGADGKTEARLEPAAIAAAAKALLQYMHGNRMTVTDSGAIVEQLTRAKDREGLKRIALGEDPLKVLISRARHWGPAEDEEEGDPE